MARRVGGFEAKLPRVQQYSALRKQQEASLAEHKRYAAGLQQKQQETQARSADLDVAGRLMKILDSRIPKSARQYLTTQLAQHVGVDTKSANFKGVQTALMGLDPDSMLQLQDAFGAGLEQAQPGEITQQLQGVLSGKVPFDAVVSQAQAAGAFQGSMGQDELAGGPGGDDLSSGSGGGGGAPQTAQPYQPGASGNIQSFEGQRTTPAAAQQVSPQLAGSLGLDSTQRYRNNDLVSSGYRIPMDVKDQEKLAETINTRATGLSGTINEAVNMFGIFNGRPEVLGATGTVARGVQSTIRQVEGLLNVIRPGTVNEADPDDPTTKYLTKKAETVLLRAHGLDKTAVDSARVQGMVLGLAYRMAIANDIPGNRLTNAIINQNLAMIGQSSSPEQFQAVLKDSMSGVAREFDETMQRTVGKPGMELMFGQLKDADLAHMVGNQDVLPSNIKQGLQNEMLRRKQIAQGQTPPGGVQRASPTLEEEEQTLGQLETGRKTRELQRFDQTMDLEQNREQRAVQAEQRAEQREDRLAEAQVRSGDLQREQFEYRKAQDVKEENRENAKHIANAFAQFAKAFAGGGASIGGVSLPQGQQDAGAFQIAAAPQRLKPNIPGR